MGVEETMYLISYIGERGYSCISQHLLVYHHIFLFTREGQGEDLCEKSEG